MTNQVSDAAAARLLGGRRLTTNTVDLSVGEPGFDTPAEIRAAATRAMQGGATRYTPRLGLDSLRDVVCARLEADKGYRPEFEDTVITAGGSPATAIAIAAACTHGSTILVPDPGWPNYEIFASRIGVGSRRYSSTVRQALDLDEIESLIDGTTRMVVVNSPANPTGALASREDLEALVELAARHDLWILSDEAYESIVFDGAKAVSPCAVGGFGRTFAAYTLSKTYAMTGWRVGYLVVPLEFRRAALELQATISGCAPSVAQHAAEYALTTCAHAANAMRRVYEQQRDVAVKALDGTDLVDGVPAGAFYLWLSVATTGMTGVEFTEWLANDAEVIVSAGEVYSTNRTHVRVSFSGREAALREGLLRIRQSVDSRKAADRTAGPIVADRGKQREAHMEL